MTQRQKFEAWANARAMPIMFENNRYWSHDTHIAWQAWQAAQEITPAMIDAGAQRLVSWEDGCTWPDSWRAIDVAAARNSAERVLRSALFGGGDD